MKLRFLTYEKAEGKHPGCYLDIIDRKIDKDFPNYEEIPVSNYPAIWVWPDKASSIDHKDGSNCIAIYWLRETDW